LKSVVFAKEISTTFENRNPEAFNIPELGEMVVESISPGERFQIRISEAALSFHPRGSLVRIEFFKPAIGVSNFHAVKGFNYFPRIGVRIGEWDFLCRE
jgi:hypothetical protein